MIGLSVCLSRGQRTVRDYYLGGNKIKWWQISISTMATQCSTNSLIGAPAFVAFAAGGGLIWLQYELAVPLAMIFIMALLFPFYRKANIVSVYEYLEKRFGIGTRTTLSVLFQFMRAFSTGVTVYGISLVVSQCVQVPFWTSVVLLASVTIVYDSIGGMRAVVISDVIQMVVLYLGVLLIGAYALKLIGGFSEIAATVSPERLASVDFSHHGLGDGHTFSFWPMLIGGFFLYVSYYGCDQTQVQRELSSESIDHSRASLFMNGLLRFPLVLSYCIVGVLLAAFAARHPEFLDRLKFAGEPEYNLAVPVFVLQYLPHGVIGMIMVGLFAAAMSSLDSTINSLSALSVRDIYERFFLKESEPADALRLWWSKGTTVFWGVLCTAFAFVVGDISESVIESINKIGSLFNGPILATFLLAILTSRATGEGAMIGIGIGFATNLMLWRFMPGVSWLWWNVAGCAVTFLIGYGASQFFPSPPKEKTEGLVYRPGIMKLLGVKKNPTVKYLFLGLYFIVILVFLMVLQNVLV